MAHTQLTQCPHCKASFKVSDEQLGAANGRVRCGACLNIFDAIAYQINTDKQLNEDQENLKKELNDSLMEEDFAFDNSDTLDLEQELLHTRDNEPQEDDDFSVFADDPEEDSQEKGYSGRSKFGDELSTSFLELDKAGNDKDKFKTQFLDEERLDEPQEDVDESWAASILDDLDEPTQQRKEPSLTTPENSDAEIASPTQKQTQDHPIDLPTELNDFAQQDFKTLRFEYDQDTHAGSSTLVKGLLVLLNISLFVILVGQVSWFHYEKLAKYPQIEKLFVLACERFKCTLPDLSDLSKIQNRNLVVRSHPTTFNALIIETIITNHAGFEQAFPDISLAFSNINNQVIAQRLFSPTEYLNAETLTWSGMPPEQPIQIVLEIIDPGADAVNYKLNFHPISKAPIDQ